MKWYLYILIIFVVSIGSFILGRQMVKTITPEIKIDTVIIRDTIREIIPIPKNIYIARIDTILVDLPGDTIKVIAEIPIEKKVYETADYRATIEGFRSELVSMDIFKQIQFITKTETIKIQDRRRWGLGISAGYGATAVNGQIKAVPYIGLGVSYNILTF